MKMDTELEKKIIEWIEEMRASGKLDEIEKELRVKYVEL